MLLAVLAVLAAGAPGAAPATTPPAQKPAAEAKDKSDMVCKTQQVTGSMFPKKVCYSKAEADDVRALEQQRLRQSQTGGLIRGN